jgi:hypothetical protein
VLEEKKEKIWIRVSRPSKVARLYSSRSSKNTMKTLLVATFALFGAVACGSSTPAAEAPKAEETAKPAETAAAEAPKAEEHHDEAKPAETAAPAAEAPKH